MQLEREVFGNVDHERGTFHFKVERERDISSTSRLSERERERAFFVNIQLEV